MNRLCMAKPEVRWPSGRVSATNARKGSMQSLFIGLGAVVASALPWLMTNIFHVGIASGGPGTIPLNVKLSFYVGAAAFVGAVLWTILTTKEYPPEDMAAFEAMKASKVGIGGGLAEI